MTLQDNVATRSTTRTNTTMKGREHGNVSKIPQVQRAPLRQPQAAVANNSSLHQQPPIPKLRRKKSNLGQLVSDMRKDPASRREARGLSILLPPDVSIPRSSIHDIAQDQSASNSTQFYDFDRRVDIATPYSAHTPLSAQSTTPSLIFSHLSHTTTTPTSSLAYSPPVSRSPNLFRNSGFSPLFPSEQAQRLYDERSISPGVTSLYHKGTVSHVSPVIATPSMASPREEMSNGITPRKVSINVSQRTALKPDVKYTRLPVTSSLGIRSSNRAPTKSAVPIRPPELAHLDNHNDATRRVVQAPPRPSRHGVDGLGDMQPASPQVTTFLPRPASLLARHQSVSRKNVESSRSVYSQPVQVQSSSQASNQSARLALVEEKAGANANPVSKRDINPKSNKSGLPESSTLFRSNTKRGFFSRKEKSTTVTRDADPSELHKKGPMAGTGHEGYGKHANPRRISVSNSTKRASSGSAMSSAANDILARSTQPVYLRSVNGTIVTGDRSSSNSDATVTSQISSQVSSATSQSSIPARPTYSDDSARLPMPPSTPSIRGTGSRGRGSWSGTTRADGPRKLSKERKMRDQKKIIPAAKPGTTRTDDLPFDPEFRTKLKKPGFMSALFSRSSTKVHLGPASSSRLPVDVKKGRVEGTSQAQPVQRAVAHYLEPETTTPPLADEAADIENIARIMDEAAGAQAEYQSETASIDPSRRVSRTISNDSQSMRPESAEINLTLSPELRRQHSQRLNVTPSSHFEDFGAVEPGRPPRLHPVGRIPQVTSRSIHQRISSTHSFSRPFSVSPPMPSATFDAPSQDALFNSERQDVSYETDMGTSQAQRESSDFSRQGPSNQSSVDFMKMRKNSNHSSSSGSGNFFYPTLPPDAMATIAGSPTFADESWPEYDDFLDTVETTAPRSSRAMSRMVNKSKTTGIGIQLSRIAVASEQPRSKTAFPRLGEMAATLRPDLSPFQGTERRSRFFSGFEHPAIQDSNFPQPGLSVIAIPEEGEGKLVRRSSSGRKRGKQASVRKTPSQTQVEGTPARKRSSSHSSTTDSSTIGRLSSYEDSSLQLAACKVSQWLTFGRLLVGPADEAYHGGKINKILVVDGLGREWPLFCAKTFPHAAVTGLGPAPDAGSLKFPGERPNGFVYHSHQVELGVKFPFKKDIFDAVVFRFPVAMDDRNLGYAISECHRVLVPGGYFEFTSLDLDQANMGPRARRAIKELKIRLQAADANVSLKPASDNVEHIMGQRGFQDLNRVILGVPVSGNMSMSPRLSRNQSDSSIPELTMKAKTYKTDEDITKLIAKVGRWWYSECYEKRVVKEGGKSIWTDAALLRECKEAETAFKLYVCTAQKAMMSKRKTRSL